MPDEPIDQVDEIEDHVGLTESDGFEITTSGESVTTRHLYADIGDGKEKEATLLSHHAGASSDAPASSGIPSAMRQRGINDVTPEQDKTPMADRREAVHEDTQP